MADQKRWFKVWTSIVANAHFAEMSLEDIGRWTLLGAATALDGDRGYLEVPGSGRELCRLLRVDGMDAVKSVLERLRSVHFEEGKTRHGVACVTWKNWKKYQEDSTQAQRQKTSRSKRRGEEKRGEERRDNPPITPPPHLKTGWPDKLTEVHDRLTAIHAPPSLFDPDYWTRIDEWLGPDESGVAYLLELDKYLAWIAGLPQRQRNRNHARGFRNWLATAEARAVEDKRRHAQGATNPRRW